jgi:hypothetical protein
MAGQKRDQTWDVTINGGWRVIKTGSIIKLSKRTLHHDIHVHVKKKKGGSN